MARANPLISLIASVVLLAWLSVSGAGAWLFGPDHLEPVREAIRTTEQERREVLGWYHNNATQQGNWTFRPDPTDLNSILPRSYKGKDLGLSDGAYYACITGFYKGEWTGWDFSTQANRTMAIESRLNTTLLEQKDPFGQNPEYLPGINETTLQSDRGKFDWLPKTPGRITFQLQEEYVLPGNVSLVKGSLGIEAPENSSGVPDSLDFTIEGLHFLHTGSLFLLAVGDESNRGNDIRDVIGMIPQDNKHTSNLTVTAIDKSYDIRVKLLQEIIDSGSYDAGNSGTSSSPSAEHNCTLHLYGQLKSAGQESNLQELLDTLEDEIEDPTGINTIRPPPLEMALTIYSPDCHFVLSSSKVEGLLESKLWKKAVRYATIYFFVLLIQTRLLVQQMEVTRTPSGLNKVDYRTFVSQSILDAYGCLAHLSVAVALENETTIPLIACAFMSAICFLAFGYRYTLTIFRNQVESAPAPAPAPAARTQPPVPSATPALGDQASATAVAPMTTSDTPYEPDAAMVSEGAGQTGPNQPDTANEARMGPEAEEARRRGATIFVGGAFLLAVGFFPVIMASIMLPVLYSFWVPQILRNVRRGTRRAIQKRCVVGTTLCRLFLPLYIFGCPDNVLFIDASPWIYVLAGWVGLQAVVLLGQDIFGAHFFVPARYVPSDAMAAWDWHPPISAADEDPEAVRSLGDCAICLNAIEPKERSQARRRRRRQQRYESGRSQRFGRSDASQYLYQALAEAEDYEVPGDGDSDQDPEPQSHGYPPEKSKDRISPSSSAYTHTRQRPVQVVPRWRRWVARGIRQALRWKEELGSAGTLRRKRTEIMVAPCNHVFHTHCLERWLTIKTECPSCRSSLPPV